jgi:hypothetical protein
LTQVGFECGAAEGLEGEEPDGVQLLGDREDIRAAQVTAEQGLVAVAEGCVGQPQSRPGSVTD